jgi:ketosteroid isomerase-like protein
MSQHPTTLTDPKAICAHSLEIMADGDLADFEALVHPEAIDREESGPPATRGTGPAAFHAIALWLRGAFSDLCWDVHHMAADSDLVAIRSTWSGRHVRPFAATQSHWFRLADGKIIEHWANRDDLAMAQQLGWIPPSPRYLARMALAKHRARTAAR